MDTLNPEYKVFIANQQLHKEFAQIMQPCVLQFIAFYAQKNLSGLAHFS